MNVYTLQTLSEYVQCSFVGDGQIEIHRVAPLNNAPPHSISFLANPKFIEYLSETTAAAVILSEQYQSHCSVAMLFSDNPYATYAKIAQLLHPLSFPQAGIHPSAVISPTAIISKTAYIGANTTIGNHVKIADNVYIGANSVVEDQAIIDEETRLVAQVFIGQFCQLGKRVLVHPGVVIGSDGFGFAKEQEYWLKIPQLGRVIIGDDVEVGANTTIDRGTLEDTIIEEGAKLDNLIQVGHNVHIGAHTAIAGCVGISGSTKIGKRCVIAGGVGLVGHIEIADDIQIGGMSLVTKSLTKPGMYASGIAAEDYAHWRKNAARFRQLDILARRIYELEKKLEAKQ